MDRRRRIPWAWGILLSIACLPACAPAGRNGKILRAGAAGVDITAQEFPARVSGGFFEARHQPSQGPP